MPKIKTSRNRKTCSVFGCMNSNLQNPEMAFFSLPSDPQRLSSWLSLMDREDLSNKPERHYRVCETHFDRGCILLTSNRKVLKKNALPSMLLPATARQEKGVQTPRALLPVIFTLKPEDASKPLLNSDDVTDNTSLYCEEGTAARGRGELLDASGNTVGRIQDGFQCNLCNADIFGFRYVCVQCVDYDLCATCEARGSHASHYVLRVPGPRPYAETQAMLSRIRRQLLAVGPDNAGLSDSVKFEIKLEMNDPFDPGPDPLQPSEPAGQQDKAPTRTGLETFTPGVIDTKQKGERGNAQTGKQAHTQTNTGIHTSAVHNLFAHELANEPDNVQHIEPINDDDLPLKRLCTELPTYIKSGERQLTEPIDHMPYKTQNIDISSENVPLQPQYLDRSIESRRHIDLQEKRQTHIELSPKNTDPGSFGCEIYTHNSNVKCDSHVQGNISKMVPAGTLQKDVARVSGKRESAAGTSQSRTMNAFNMNL